MINQIKNDDFLNDPYPPFRLVFEITGRCNASCIYCAAASITRTELPLNHVIKILDEAAEYGIIAITYLGGEPFLRRDFNTILELSVRKGFIVGFSTNGTIFNERIKKVLINNSESIEVGISLDSGIKSIHESIRKGTSFNKIVEWLKFLSKYDIKYGINYTLTTLNKNSLATIIDLLYKLNCLNAEKIVVNRLVITGRAKEYMRPSLIDKVNDFIGGIMKLEDYGMDLKISYSGPALECKAIEYFLKKKGFLRNRNISLNPYYCDVAENVICISPDGFYYPCNAYYNTKLGMAGKICIDAVWRSDFLNYLRNKRISIIKYKKVESACKYCPYLTKPCITCIKYTKPYLECREAVMKVPQLLGNKFEDFIASCIGD